MDFDYVEDSRPRFQVQSGPIVSDPDDCDIGSSGEAGKCQAGACVVVGVLLLSLAAMAIGGSNQQVLVAWVAISLLIGPFAPRSVTGGDCRVGCGELLPPPALSSEKIDAKPALTSNRNAGYRKPAVAKVGNELGIATSNAEKASLQGLQQQRKAKQCEVAGDEDEDEGDNTDADDEYDEVLELAEDGDWTDMEMELLRKQMSRIPRGTLRRWQLIAEAFGGTRSVRDVVAMSKRLAERKLGQNQSSYSKFLTQRKQSAQIISSPLSRRDDSFSSIGELRDGLEQNLTGTGVSVPNISSNVAAVVQSNEKMKSGEWTENEDKALLSALKVFPKDTPLRWEKVSASVPGRSKGQCFKRFSELKENFRTMKAENKPSTPTD